MKNAIKYFLAIAVIGLLGYKSVYFKRLSSLNNNTATKFDANGFAAKMWSDKMPARIDSAVNIKVLMDAVSVDKEAAFEKFSNALAIGNYRYALIQANATIKSIDPDEVSVTLQAGDSTLPAVIATEYIYGSAIRDASRLVDVKDFSNASELNSISEEMNKIVRTTIVPPFKNAAKVGDTINVTAAIELNKEHIKWTGLELIPVQLQIVP